MIAILLTSLKLPQTNPRNVHHVVHKSGRSQYTGDARTDGSRSKPTDNDFAFYATSTTSTVAKFFPVQTREIGTNFHKNEPIFSETPEFASKAK